MPTPSLTETQKSKIYACLMQGMRPIDIAEQCGVSPSSVSRVKASMPRELLNQMKSEEVERISGLVMMQLEVGIESSIAIAKQGQDDEWRKAQPAAQLATFYGVITDKSIRLLEASEAAALAQAEIENNRRAEDFSDSVN